MQNEVKKITRLVDEVTSLLMRSGSNDINVRIKRDSELSTITIIDYNSAYPELPAGWQYPICLRQ